MTTLAANMDDEQDYIPQTGLAPGFYQLDSEMLRVRGETIQTGRGRDRSTAGQYVERAIGGTTAAAHTAGATLTAVNDPAAPGGGSGGVTVTGSQGGGPFAATSLELPGVATDLGGGSVGVALAATLLGPFHVAFNTPNLMDPAEYGADVGTLPGDCLFQFFAIITTNWNQPGELAIAASVDGHMGANVTVAAYSDSVAAITAGTTFLEGFRETGQTPVWGVTTNPMHIVVGFYPNSTHPTTGEADIYAIIATPAS